MGEEPWRAAAARLGARLEHRLRKVVLAKGRKWGSRTGDPKPPWYPYQTGYRDDGPKYRALALYKAITRPDLDGPGRPVVP